MTSSRLRPGELLAAAGGALLLVALVMDWYGLAGRPAVAGGEGSVGRNAWQSFDVLDVVLALVGLAGIALVVLNAVRQSPALPVAAEVLTTVLALVATLFVAYRLLDEPGPDDVVGLEPGAYLGLLATAAVLYGAFRALQDESGRAMAEPPVELRAAPPAAGGVKAAAGPPADAPESIEPPASPAEDPIAEPALGTPSRKPEA